MIHFAMKYVALKQCPSHLLHLEESPVYSHMIFSNWWKGMLDMLDPSKEVEYSQVVMHCLVIKDGVNRLVNMIIEREDVPPIISCSRLPEFYIQTIQEFWFVVLSIGGWNSCIDNWHQIMGIQLTRWALKLNRDEIHQVLKKVSLTQKQIILYWEHVLFELELDKHGLYELPWCGFSAIHYPLPNAGYCCGVEYLLIEVNGLDFQHPVVDIAALAEEVDRLPSQKNVFDDFTVKELWKKIHINAVFFPSQIPVADFLVVFYEKLVVGVIDFSIVDPPLDKVNEWH